LNALGCPTNIDENLSLLGLSRALFSVVPELDRNKYLVVEAVLHIVVVEEGSFAEAAINY
jgi:hypothetical protein